MKTIRCAIYTRKSTDEGLEQDFNSLDAQRDACAAYVLSQASEGWNLLPANYDDGGVSGGTLRRPALQRLLSDVAARRVDIIVVYKVDRLTRSLFDFSKLVEAFDAAGVSFVSVTQSFNTTTSMGRLTLNMLLSFAQFEREVTTERIRDKIAASKAKGMWMGGTPPLGYRANGRTLALVEDHAEIVRDIYRSYLELGNAGLVAEQLDKRGVLWPVRVSKAGRTSGGTRFARGPLYAILKNRIYVGEIAHPGQIYPGQHPPLIERATWDRVQAGLAAHVKGGPRTRRSSRSILAGKIVDEAGSPLLAVHTTKGKARYRYYVSQALHLRDDKQAGPGHRLPAREIEMLVAQQVAAALDDPLELAASVKLTHTPDSFRCALGRCAELAAGLRHRPHAPLATLLAQIRVGADKIEIDLAAGGLASALALPVESITTTLTLSAEARTRRTGQVVRLVQSDGTFAADGHAKQSLIKLLVNANKWWKTLRLGQLNIDQLATQEGVCRSYVSRVVRLAFLSPAIVDAIVAGRQPADLDRSALLATHAIDCLWTAQERRHLNGRQEAHSAR